MENFCKHVKEIEEQYVEKDGIVEDTLEEMVIELGEEDTDDEEEMIDDADRRISDSAMQQATEQSGISTPTSTTPVRGNICTHSRRELSQILDKYDSNFLENVMLLP